MKTKGEKGYSVSVTESVCILHLYSIGVRGGSENTWQACAEICRFSRHLLVQYVRGSRLGAGTGRGRRRRRIGMGW